MHYKTAIVRKPGANCAAGLTTVDLGVPDYGLLLEQHAAYVETLKELDVEVVELEILDNHPDAYFVEDVAVVTPEVAVITRPGAIARRGEAQYMIPVLEKYRQCVAIEAPGAVDGGDVLVVGKHCIVGLSERTNREGAEQLCHILGEYGYRGDVVDVPEALHFKSSVNFVDQQTLLVTQSCQHINCLSDYRRLVVPESENYAANVVWMNGSVLIPEGYPGTRQILVNHGYSVIEMGVSEIAKMDGGLTCLSLRLE